MLVTFIVLYTEKNDTINLINFELIVVKDKTK